ncbi:MAG: YceI family protein [Leucobacter sp.]
MRKRTKAALIAVVCVLALGATAAVAGPLIYRDLFATPAAEAPTLTAEDSALEPNSTRPVDLESLSGEWIVAAGSEAGYRVNEVLNGVDVTVTGRTTEVTGGLTVNELTLESAEFTVDVASISTDSSNRDSYFRDDAMQVAVHPTATFRLTSPVTTSAPPLAGETVEHELTGELTLAGVTRTVTFTAQARTDGSIGEIAGQIPITFSDFGVTAPSLGFVSVEDSGYVEFQLVLERA